MDLVQLYPLTMIEWLDDDANTIIWYVLAIGWDYNLQLHEMTVRKIADRIHKATRTQQNDLRITSQIVYAPSTCGHLSRNKVYDLFCQQISR